MKGLVSVLRIEKWSPALSLLILFSCSAAYGQSCTTATCTAASVSQSDVQAALPSPSNTHATVVVNIPSGTSAWTGAINYTIPAAVTNLTIQGQTTVSCTGTVGTSSYTCTATDNTIIEDDSTSSTSILTITTGSASTFLRLTGLTVKPFSSSIPCKNHGIVDFYGHTANFRWDHSDLSSSSNDNVGIEVDGQIEGVFDHNVFNTPQGENVDIQNDLLDNVGNGDGGWMAATQFGSQHFLFLESNYVVGGSTNCGSAGREVLRYNTFLNTPGGANGAVHSTKDYAGALRGCRAEEFYHNYISGSPVNYAATGGEGSTTLNWGNINGNLSFDYYYAGGLYRNQTGTGGAPTGKSPPNGWAWCGTTIATSYNIPGTGASSWDGNSSTATGYPCLDGLGRGQQTQAMNGASFPSRINTVAGTQAWSHQYLEPMYFFMNTLPNGMSGYLNLRDISTVANRDVYYDCDHYNSACSSGFTGAFGTGYGTSTPTTSGAYTNAPNCTAGPGGTYGQSPTGSYGVAYFATDANGGRGELYVCTATNTWTAVYEPYIYPHPLVSGVTQSTSTVQPPTNLAATIQ